MDPQIPEMYKKEEKRLVELYMGLPGENDFNHFLRENASKAYLQFRERRARRARSLNKKGIIEN